MNVMIFEEKVKHDINYIVRLAKENKANIRYRLEKLPMNDDYDTAVHEYISSIENYIRNNKDDYLEMVIDDLIDYYVVNQEYYEDKF